MKFLNQSGLMAPFLMLLAALGVVIFIFLSSTVSFKLKLFSLLYPKPPSHAISDTSGAFFTLSAPSTTIISGQQVRVSIMVRTDTHPANLFSAKINFDPTKLQIVSVDTTGTFINQWADKSYSNNTGKASIVGGIPKPGFKTAGSDALMATLVFSTASPISSPIGTGSTTISFDSLASIYRNSDNVNFLDGTTNLTLSIQPIASPTPTSTPQPSVTPTPTPTSSPTPSPSASPSPVGCSLIGASWSTLNNPVNEGTIVTLLAQGNGDCVGKSVAFTVKEDDGLLGYDSVLLNPVNATFISDIASTTWVSEYQPDGFNGLNDPPEYYFEVSLVGDSAILHSSDPSLLVNKLPTTVYKQGDANRNGLVDLQDLSIMLSYWFDTSSFPDEIDINGDGIINTFDYSAMLVILTNEGIIGVGP